MSKMLNLDDLAKEERVLKFKGKEHALKEVSVGDFIEISKLTEQRGEELPMSEQLELMVGMIMRRFPTVSEEDLRELTMAQLDAILAFASQGDVAEEGDETEKK